MADYGSVKVICSSIGASVVVGGKRCSIDSSGFCIISNLISPKTYNVVVTLSGYNRFSTKVTTSKNTVSEVMVTLVKIPITGFLNITSTPSNASVYIDGSSTANITSISNMEVTKGLHTLKFTLNTYRDCIRRVVVGAGKIVNINVNLVLKTGIARFKTIPSGSEIYIDDVKQVDSNNNTVTTPKNIKSIPEGIHTYKFSKVGYNTSEGNFTIVDNKTITVPTVRLNPIVEPSVLYYGPASPLIIANYPGVINVVKTNDFSKDGILNALKSGAYYYTNGPFIKSIDVFGNNIKVKMYSVVSNIGLYYDSVNVPSKRFTNTDSATFIVPPGVEFVWIQAGDELWYDPINAKTAYTSKIFVGQNPYPTSGSWYGGAIHAHSISREGDLTPQQLKDKYKSAGYKFLVITDHVETNVVNNPVDSIIDDPDFVVLPGLEFNTPENKLHLGIISSQPLNFDTIKSDLAQYTTDSPENILAVVHYFKLLGCYVIINHPEYAIRSGYDLWDIGADAIEQFNSYYFRAMDIGVYGIDPSGKWNCLKGVYIQPIWLYTNNPLMMRIGGDDYHTNIHTCP